MSGTIVELFGDEDLIHMRQKIKRWNAAHILLAAAALTACIVMIMMTRTINASQMEISSVIVSTVVGWVILYQRIFIVTPCKRELRHALMLGEGERERIAGVPALTDIKIAIRGSITARKVDVLMGDSSERVMVCESKAQALRAPNILAVYTVHGYVAAVEVAK